jgi:general secretion pathway protein H
VRTPTYGRTKSDRSARQRRGLTLIEILLVLALLSLLITAVVPDINRVFRAGVQSSVRRYSALVRYTYDQAVLTGRVHRIVLDLDAQSWKVEVALPGELPLEREKKERQSNSSGEKPKEGEDESDPNGSFQITGKNLVDKIPKGVEISEVQSWRLGEGSRIESTAKGQVSIYAFPSGFIDESTVVLSEVREGKRQRFLLTTVPLTGKVDVKTDVVESTQNAGTKRPSQ